MSLTLDQVEAVCKQFVFVPHLDESSCHDLRRSHGSALQLMQEAANDPACLCFNTLGFMKPVLNCVNVSGYMGGLYDGLYVKLSALETLASSNPSLYSLIETSAVPITVSFSVNPQLTQANSWLSTIDSARKSRHLHQLSLIHAAHSIAVDQNYDTDIMWQPTLRNVFKLSSTARSILVVNFNHGAFCLMALLANSYSRVTVLDTLLSPRINKCIEYLEQHFPGRIEIVRKSPMQFVEACAGTFDLIVYD